MNMSKVLAVVEILLNCKCSVNILYCMYPSLHALFGVYRRRTIRVTLSGVQFSIFLQKNTNNKPIFIIHMADKLRDQQTFAHLHAKHIGLGDADTDRHEFMSNVFRDSYASVLGHHGLLEYTSLSRELPKQLLKQQLIEKMVRPCGNRGENGN